MKKISINNFLFFFTSPKIPKFLSPSLNIVSTLTNTSKMIPTRKTKILLNNDDNVIGIDLSPMKRKLRKSVELDIVRRTEKSPRSTMKTSLAEGMLEKSWNSEAIFLREIAATLT